MIKDVDEAITHCKEKVEELKKVADYLDADTSARTDCLECASDHEQLAAWLEELKQRRNADRWIPISERLPNRNGVYIVTRIIEGTRIVDASYFDGQNTWHNDVCVNHGRPYLNDIVAWKIRPEPYEEGK